MAEPTLPFTLRFPTNRADNPDGRHLNSGTNYVAVQVIHDPNMELRGECRQGHGGPVIALREWNEQVFLHELLHAALGYAQPLVVTTHPPHGHEIISRIEVALWETGWRMNYPPAPVVTHRLDCPIVEAATKCACVARQLRLPPEGSAS